MQGQRTECLLLCFLKAHLPHLVLLLQASKPSKMKGLKPESCTQKPLHDGNLSSRICWNMACVLFTLALTVEMPVAGSQVLLPSGLMSFLEFMLGCWSLRVWHGWQMQGTWVVLGLPGDVSAPQRFLRSNMVVRVRMAFHGKAAVPATVEGCLLCCTFVPAVDWCGRVGPHALAVHEAKLWVCKGCKARIFWTAEADLVRDRLILGGIVLAHPAGYGANDSYCFPKITKSLQASFTRRFA